MRGQASRLSERVTTRQESTPIENWGCKYPLYGLLILFVVLLVWLKINGGP
jgi:hypothetical protein